MFTHVNLSDMPINNIVNYIVLKLNGEETSLRSTMQMDLKIRSGNYVLIQYFDVEISQTEHGGNWVMWPPSFSPTHHDFKVCYGSSFEAWRCNQQNHYITMVFFIDQLTVISCVTMIEADISENWKHFLIPLLVY